MRTPFVELPRKFLATIEDRKGDVSRVRGWIAERDALPLGYGYLTKLVGEMLQHPAEFRMGLPAKWNALRPGEYLAFFAAYEEVLPRFEEYLKAEPEDGSVLVKLARYSFVDGEIERGLRYLARAVKADPYCIRAYSVGAGNYLEKGEIENAERLLRAGLRLAPDVPELEKNLERLLEQRASGTLPLRKRPSGGMPPGHP